MISPKYTGYVSSERTVHIWHCPICGNEFETVDAVAKRADDEDDEFNASRLVS
jgi:hypothetical protein